MIHERALRLRRATAVASRSNAGNPVWLDDPLSLTERQAHEGAESSGPLVTGWHLPSTQAKREGHWVLDVQGLSGGMFEMHVPTWQVPSVVPAEHDEPSGDAGSSQIPVAGLHVPATWHWSRAAHVTGFAPVHVPAWQASDWVQSSASSQDEPSVFAGSLHRPVMLSHVPTSWH
jgi:hypothetical protein